LDAPGDVTAVELGLFLARAAGAAEAARWRSRCVQPRTYRRVAEVLEPRELHLELALVGLRALREDRDDEARQEFEARAGPARASTFLFRPRADSSVEDDERGVQLRGRRAPSPRPCPLPA